MKRFFKKIKSGLSKVWDGLMKAWEAVEKAWDFITKPFEKAWKWFMDILGEGWRWLTGKKGGPMAKIAKGFEHMFGFITKSKAWQAITKSGIGKWVAKWGPKILTKGRALLGKIGSVLGWVVLLWDIKDMTEVSLCVGHALGKADMPSFCDGEVTKRIVGWVSGKAANA